jgi:hypothetical protein
MSNNFDVEAWKKKLKEEAQAEAKAEAEAAIHAAEARAEAALAELSLVRGSACLCFQR